MNTFDLGLIASLYGLSGVFAVLILFYILTKLMIAFIKEK
jgi:Na+-transporting methylmalonyl-CoA/oxaloacetate decarboxylase gamma subunit